MYRGMSLEKKEDLGHKKYNCACSTVSKSKCFSTIEVSQVGYKNHSRCVVYTKGRSKMMRYSNFKRVRKYTDQLRMEIYTGEEGGSRGVIY